MKKYTDIDINVENFKPESTFNQLLEEHKTDFSERLKTNPYMKTNKYNRGDYDYDYGYNDRGSSKRGRRGG